VEAIRNNFLDRKISPPFWPARSPDKKSRDLSVELFQRLFTETTHAEDELEEIARRSVSEICRQEFETVFRRLRETVKTDY
jgi:hypothetical protein